MSEKFEIGKTYSLNIGDSDEILEVVLKEIQEDILLFDHESYSITVNLKTDAVDLVSKEGIIAKDDNTAYMLDLAKTLVDHLGKHTKGTMTLQNNLKKFIKKSEKSIKEV